MHKSLLSRTGQLCTAVLVILASQSSAANLIVNGGFDTGDLSGWTQAGDSQYVGVTNVLSHSGQYSAYLGAIGSGSISQTFSTIPGVEYWVSFWLAGPSIPPTPYSEHLLVDWNNNPIDDETFVNSPPPYFESIQRLVTATSDTTTLSFEYNREIDSFWVDDVSVVAVPEASTWAMMLLGFAGIGLVLRRQLLELAA